MGYPTVTMSNLPSDPRKWWYYPIEMPVNEQGHGPINIKSATQLRFEVWDRVFITQTTHEFLPDAIQEAIQRNIAKGMVLENGFVVPVGYTE